MVAVIDLKSEFASLTMLTDRTPASSDADRKASGARLAPYRDGALFSAKFAGTSAWERHPQGDEIVQIVDGATTLHLITKEGRQALTLTAGMIAIVPQNVWHQFEAPDGVSVMTVTPQPTEHVRIDVPDPTSIDRPRSRPQQEMPGRRKLWPPAARHALIFPARAGQAEYHDHRDRQ